MDILLPPIRASLCLCHSLNIPLKYTFGDNVNKSLHMCVHTVVHPYNEPLPLCDILIFRRRRCRLLLVLLEDNDVTTANCHRRGKSSLSLSLERARAYIAGPRYLRYRSHPCHSQYLTYRSLWQECSTLLHVIRECDIYHTVFWCISGPCEASILL